MELVGILDNLETIASAPSGIGHLRHLVLEMAVRGQLVESQESDEPVHTLLERIDEERRILEEGARGSGSASAADGVQDPPFEIPSGWAWARLDSLVYLQMGQSPPSSAYNGAGEGLPFFQGKTDFGALHPTPRSWCTEPTRIAEPGDVLLSVRAPVGPTNIATETCCIGRGLASLRPLAGTPSGYINWALRALETQIASMATGTTFVAVSKRDLAPFPIPVPPLGEQWRIVAKVDELMALCDELERCQMVREATLDATRRSAIADLVQSESLPASRTSWERLNLAWTDLTSGPSGAREIRDAILRLGVSGKFSDEEWIDCQFGDQVSLQRGFDITKKEQLPGPYPVVSSGGVSSFHSSFKCHGPGVVLGRKGSVGRVHFVDSNYWPHDTTLWVKDFHGNDPEFVFMFLLGFPLLDYESSTANPSLNRNRLHPIPIRWPPASVQHEIVRTIRSLWLLCDELERSSELVVEISSAFAASAVDLISNRGKM